MSSEESYPTTLSVTNKTLRFGNQVYQIRNISQINKYKIERDDSSNTNTMLFCGFVCIVGLYNGLQSPIDLWWLVLIAIVCGLIAFVAAKEISKPSDFALSIETNAGSSKLFSSNNENFIDNLCGKISDIMDDDSIPVSYTVNVENNSITDNSAHTSGDTYNQEISGSNVTAINNSTVQDSFNENYDKADVKIVLDNIDDLISRDENNAVASTLFKNFKDELKKENPDKSLLKQYWDGILNVSPAVANVADVTSKIIPLFS